VIRSLTADEVARYDVVPAELARRVRLVRVRFLPGGYGAMTLGRLVLLARPVAGDGSSALLAHELVHVRQWAELGVVGFLARYLWGFAAGLGRARRWRPAYLAITLERQARAEAAAWRHRRSAGPGSAGDGGEAVP
jgi:hypothetical protein